MPVYNAASYNMIYVYAIHDEAHKDLMKIGKGSFDSCDSVAMLPPNCPKLNQVAHERIDQQTKTALVEYELLHSELATRYITMSDGTQQLAAFDDKAVHDVLYHSGYESRKFLESGKPSEWFKVDLNHAKEAVSAVKAGKESLDTTSASHTAPTKKQYPIIKLRKEQSDNVEYTSEIFTRYDTMLWDCKMRYGKTVTAYALIKKMGFRKVIVITHRPAVEDSWDTDHELMFHDTNHRFIDKTAGTYTIGGAIDANNDAELNNAVKSGDPFVYFASIQDLRGSALVNGQYDKNNAVFRMDWDLLIIDEAHEGLTELGQSVVNLLKKEKTKVLYLSGTPYKIMDDFGENRFSWTYEDEQAAKDNWENEHPGEPNPYEDLPRMNILAFDLARDITDSYQYVTEDSAFNFREFFRVWTGDTEKDFGPVPSTAKVGDFVYAEDVYRFLSLLAANSENSNYPFATEENRDMFRHTFWLVPGVKEARALSVMIKTHPDFEGFAVVNIAGEGDAEQPYDEALRLVKSSIKAYDRTITISCGKLTTGVTVREWTGILMLSGSASTAAAGYMQAIFRVQSPGCINGKRKTNCYVFDFAPDRALRVVGEVHGITAKQRGGDGEKAAVGRFINFCPVLAVTGNSMRPYNVEEMMRQIKRISVEHAINSGFDDDTVYMSDAGIHVSKEDEDILKRLTAVVVPRKKGSGKTDVVITAGGMTGEEHEKAKKAKRKNKNDRTPEEEELLKKLKEQRAQQQKLFDLLRAVTIRLPLLFYGADLDINEVIHLEDFVRLVDDESWQEFMPKGLKKKLFLDILRFYDEDVLVGAGMRIRRMAKAADILPPTYRARRIVEIISHFKNPDKETVLTPWRVVNMHLGDTLGGYNFFNEDFTKEFYEGDEPRFVDHGDVTADLLTNPNVRILEMNSKSGLYPLYMAYTIYLFSLNGPERDAPLTEAQRVWNHTLERNIFVLCKTKMARTITIRTLAGYTGAQVNTIYLPALIEKRMQDMPKLAKELTNPKTWGKEGNTMKFDAVVGNPPYQISSDDDRSTSRDIPIFNYFVDAAFALKPRYASMIIPARWMASGLGLSEFRQNMLNNSSISMLFDYPVSHDVFPSVEIKGGLCYFLWDREYDGNCTVITTRNGAREDPVERVMNEYDVFVRNNQACCILKKVLAHQENSMIELLSVDKEFGWTSNFTGFHDTQAENDIPLYYSGKGKRLIGWIAREQVMKSAQLIDTWKVMVPEASSDGGQKIPDPVLGSCMVAPCPSVCTQTYLFFYTDSEEKARNIASYYKTKFFRFLVSLRKNTQHATRSTYLWVPQQDFSKPWTDEKLYAKYGLSEEEIAFVEGMIKGMEA